MLKEENHFDLINDSVERYIDDDNTCFSWLKWLHSVLVTSTMLRHKILTGSTSIINRFVNLFSLPMTGYRGALLTAAHRYHVNGILLAIFPIPDSEILSKMLAGALMRQTTQDLGVGLPLSSLEIECISLYLREKLSSQ